jgi:hypothetical protein
MSPRIHQKQILLLFDFYFNIDTSPSLPSPSSSPDGPAMIASVAAGASPPIISSANTLFGRVKEGKTEPKTRTKDSLKIIPSETNLRAL